MENGPAYPGVFRAYLRTSFAQLCFWQSPEVTEEQFDDNSGHMWWWWFGLRVFILLSQGLFHRLRAIAPHHKLSIPLSISIHTHRLTLLLPYTPEDEWTSMLLSMFCVLTVKATCPEMAMRPHGG